MFGHNIILSLNKNKRQIQTGFGGCMTILFVVTSLVYITQQVTTLFDGSQTEFLVMDQVNDIVPPDGDPKKKEDYTINMGDFSDSFNLILGTTDLSIDLFDNEYIAIKVYELKEDVILRPSEKIGLKKCTDEDLEKFLSGSHSRLYKNAVCFEDLSQIEVNSNWWEEQFTNPFIIIEGCKSTTKNGG